MSGCPDNCIRGIRQAADWLVGKYVTSLAFIPNKNTKGDRRDQGYETSINWEDDDQVVNFTLSQQHGKFGAVRLPRKGIENINTKVLFRGHLKYERKKEARNPYHGNIVFLNSLPNSVLRAIAGALAIEVTDIFPP